MTLHSNMEAFKNSLLNELPVGIDVVDQNGQVLYMNEYMQKLAGKKSLGTRCWESYRDDKTQCGNCPLKKSIEVNGSETLETNGVFGGRTFQISHFGMIVQGKKVMLEMFTDVTELKRTEEALLKSKEKFRSLFENTPDAIMTLEPPSWSFTTGNPATVKMFGAKNEEEFVSHGPWDLSPNRQPDGRASAEKAKEMIEAAMREGFRFFEWTHRRIGGQEFPADVLLTRIEQNGKMILQASVRDITERKRAEEAITRQALEYGTMLSTITEGFWLVDEHGRLLDVNDAYCSMSGYSKEELLRFTIQDIEVAESSEETAKHIQTIIKMGTHRFESTHRRKDGRVYDVEVNAAFSHEKKRFFVFIQDISERKWAEEALRENEKLLRQSQSIAGLGSYAMDIPTGIWRSSEVLDKIFGIDDTFTRSTEGWASLVHPDWRELMLSYFKDEVLAKHIRFDKEYKIIRKDDREERWVHGIGELEFDAQNKPIKMTGSILDITERKRAVEALAQERNMLRTLIDNLPDRVYIKDAESRFLLNNVAHMRALGAKSIEELVGKRDFDYRSLELAKRQYADDRKVLQSGKSLIDQEESTILENGEKGWLLSTKAPLLDSNGNVTGIVGIARDITERKRAEDVIRRQQAYFQNLFENSTIAIAMLDKSEVILDINKAFESTFQYTKEEITGKNINDVILPDSLKEEGKELTEMARNKQNIQKETVRKRKDGKLVNVSVHGFPIIINGELVGIYGVYEDISERKKLENQFLHAQRLESVGTLAGGIAHDFNNILGIIMAYTSILLRGGTKPEETSSYLSTILNAVERGTKLSRQILTFARKGDAIMEDVRVNDVLKDLDKMMQETFPKNIEIRFDLDSSISPIAMDSGQFHQAMLNLCVNARDAVMDALKQGSGGGLISIKTRLASAEELIDHKIQAPMGSYVAITVSDTGTGMNEETKQRIFEPFFTTKELGRGTGLGLAVVYGIVKSHQGFIDVKSEIGRGTDFVLYFPARRTQAKDKSPLMQGLRDVPGGSETILLVEDEMALMELLKNLLLNKGYTVLTAANGLEAVEVFARNKESIRLVLSDHGLPKLGGIEAFKKMKKMNPKVKAIIASGFIEPNQKSEILKSGVKEFVQKPYDPQEVLRKVRIVLDT